jgi:hypothetical protein
MNLCIENIRKVIFMEKVLKVLMLLATHISVVQFVTGGIFGSLVTDIIHCRREERTLHYHSHPTRVWWMIHIKSVYINWIKAAVCILFGMLIFALSYVQNNYTEVPNVIGLTYEEAVARLHASDLICSENYGYYGDVVTAINPSDNIVKRGSKIEITLGRNNVSSDTSYESVTAGDGVANSEYECIMPDVYMVQEQQALQHLSFLGYTSIEIIPQYTNTTVAGYVIATSPFAGEKMNYDDVITLYVSVNEVEQ